MDLRKRTFTKRFGIAVLPTIIAVWLPKCPLCWMGLMGALGVGSLIKMAWLRPLTMACLVLSLAVLAFRAPTRHGYGPLGTGVLATTFMYFSKFSLDSDWLIRSGAGLLFIASAWNAWPKKREKAEANCICQASTNLCIERTGALDTEVGGSVMPELKRLLGRRGVRLGKLCFLGKFKTIVPALISLHFFANHF